MTAGRLLSVNVGLPVLLISAGVGATPLLAMLGSGLAQRGRGHAAEGPPLDT